MYGDCTLVLVVITAMISILAFNSQPWMQNLLFHPYSIRTRNEWWRFLSSGFLHADWIHLLINMFVLYSFGPVVEHYYAYFFGGRWLVLYLLLYLSSIVAANATTYFRHQNDPSYRALGASGAVSAVVLTSVLFQPTSKIYLYGIIGLPGWLAGVLYLAYSQYASRQQADHINHEAHFYGAVYGVVFTLVMKPSVFSFFLGQF